MARYCQACSTGLRAMERRRPAPVTVETMPLAETVPVEASRVSTSPNVATAVTQVAGLPMFVLPEIEGAEESDAGSLFNG